MALRPSVFGRAIAVYEFSGVDHRERQCWQLVGRTANWEAAAGAVTVRRASPSMATQPPVRAVLDLGEVLHDGMVPTADPHHG